MDEHYEHDKQITASILKDIEEKKLFVAFVESDNYSPRFGYSIGLFENFMHPELIILGLDSASTGAIITNIKNEVEKGTKFLTGIKYPDFLEDFPIQFVEVQLAYYKDYLGYAGWYNNNSFDFPALQIVWPDKGGKFPWQEGFNENFVFTQPLLDRNEDFKFLEQKNLGVFTTSDVINGEPVNYVYHDEEGDWQFHSTEDPDEEDAKLVCLEELVKRDRTLNEISHLNYGESASREKIGAKWKTFKKRR